jgi:hypothetical protein
MWTLVGTLCLTVETLMGIMTSSEWACMMGVNAARGEAVQFCGAVERCVESECGLAERTSHDGMSELLVGMS